MTIYATLIIKDNIKWTTYGKHKTTLTYKKIINEKIILIQIKSMQLLLLNIEN